MNLHHINHFHQINVNIHKDQLQRRSFLKGISAASLAAGTISFSDVMTLQAEDLRKKNMACILLWMQGGPSQLETFSPKPDHANGGETKAISTNVSGIQIAEHLPHMAKVMDHVAVIRSMNNKEGNHLRATYQLHTGYPPTATVKHPSMGAIAASEIENTFCELPSYVQIGAGRGGNTGGFLGVEYDPFTLQNADTPPNNTKITTNAERYARRLKLMSKLEKDFAASGGKQQVIDHRKLYEKASRMVTSDQMKAFDLTEESSSMRNAYGRTSFGNGCLLARRLVETGVTFVEVTLGNWDTHQDNFTRVKQLNKQLDQPFAQLLKDLKQRGMLDNTLVIWTGEFGRTPKINPRTGRDHFPRAFNSVLAGGGVQGGQVIGKTDASGNTVKERPVGVLDLFQSFCKSLQIDATKERMTSIGRPIRVVDGGSVVEELFS